MSGDTTPPPEPPRPGGGPGGPEPPPNFRRYFRFFAIGFAVIIFVLLTVVLERLAGVLQPFAIAGVLCYLILPVVRFLVRRGVPKLVAYIHTSVLFFFILYGLGQLIAHNVEMFVERLPEYERNLEALTDELTVVAKKLNMLRAGERLTLEQFVARMPDGTIASLVGESTTYALGFVGNLVLVIFFMFFILLEAERLPDRIRAAYGDGRGTRLLTVLDDVSRSVQRYIILKVVVSSMTAVLALIVMACFGLDFSFLMAVLVFLLNFIPYLGSVIATILPAILGLLQFDSPLTVLWMCLLLILVQNLVGNAVEPGLLGRNLNLSPLVILMALAFWGWLWGIIGMVLAIPIMVSLRIALDQISATRPYAVLMSNAGNGQAVRSRFRDAVAAWFSARGRR